MRALRPVFLCLLLWVPIAVGAAAPRVIAVNVDGVQREALVFEPRATVQAKHPLVLAFHGHGGNMHGFARTTELETHWPQAIVVYPQGLPTASKLDPDGRKPGWQRLPGDESDRDLKFVDALLAQLRRDYKVDEQRVFATGFSNGAFFSLLLWMQRPQVFAGFSIVAGALDSGQHLNAAKPVLQISGEKDPLVTMAKAEATIAEERKADDAGNPGSECGAGCTLYRGPQASVKVLMHPQGHVYPPQAAEQTMEFFRVASATNATTAPAPSAPDAAAPAEHEPKSNIVQYKSHGQDLVAFVYKPPGNGPFPVYMWNHGADRDPMPGALLAKFWVPHGFVLFAPLRSGHGPNPGRWIVDEAKTIREQQSSAGFDKLLALHERANDDVVAAYNWIAKQPYVDAKRVVVAGGSFGAIQALLTAERDRTDVLGVRCVVAMAPAAESWRNPQWATRLSTAVDNARAPILLLQANNDYSLGPSDVLGARLDAKGGKNRHKVYPNHGDANDHAAGHGAFFSDSAVWGDDVLAWLHDCGAI